MLAEIATVCAVAIDAFARQQRAAATLAARPGKPPRPPSLPPGAAGLVDELARLGIDLRAIGADGYGLVAKAAREWGLDSPRTQFLRLLGASEEGLTDWLMRNAIHRRDLDRLRDLATGATRAQRSDALATAAGYGDQTAMELLWELAADVNGDRRVPMAQAAAFGKVEAMRWLHARGADVNRPQRRPEFPFNPLAWAMENDEKAAVELLHSWGATAACGEDEPTGRPRRRPRR
jgi:hypothetical protein